MEFIAPGWVSVRHGKKSAHSVSGGVVLWVQPGHWDGRDRSSFLDSLALGASGFMLRFMTMV